MNICVIFGEYNYFDERCIKEIKTAKKETKPDVMCVLLNKNIKNDGTFLNSNPLNYANEAIEHGADLVLSIPSVFTLCNKELYSFALLKILRLFGSDNSYYLACPLYDENLEDIEMAEALVYSENNDGFLAGNNVLKISKSDEIKQSPVDVSNMVNGLSNEILAETYRNGVKANLDINLIPILKRTSDDDMNQYIDTNKYNLLFKNTLAKTSPDIIKKHVEYISDGDEVETAHKLGISLLLQFDLSKEKIIDYIMKLDKVEVLAVKSNKRKFIKGKGFTTNIDDSNILKELNSYDTKIEDLVKLLK